MSTRKRPLRAAVIGTGGVARLRHIPGFLEAQRRGLAEVVALCDPVEESLRSALAEYEVRDGYRDYREVIARADVDVVSVATPNVYHEEISVGALEAGKHVMCEKPLAMTYAGARRMLAAAERRGLRTSVNFRYRWVPAARLLAELVERGEIGDVRHIYMNFFTGQLHDPERPIQWRQARAESGTGVLGDLSSHMFDMALRLVGPVRRLSAQMTIFTPERPAVGGGRATVDVDDASTCVLEFASGARGVVSSSAVALGRGNHQRVELYGTRGAAIYEIEREDRWGQALQVCFSQSQGQYVGFAPAPVPLRYQSSNPLDPFLDFVQAILDEREPAVTFADGVRAQELVEAAERSAVSNRWVDLPLQTA